MRLFLMLTILCFLRVGAAHAASVIVAPSNASGKAKARADLVCDGKDDQVELHQSLTSAPRVSTMSDSAPNQQHERACYGRHSVEWLPGDYRLGDTLVIPDAADMAIQAEGAYFHYEQPEGDAIVIQGMNRCRYRLGTVETTSTGAAIRVKPGGDMPALMSILSFTGLIGKNQKGTGLFIEPAIGVCTNRFEGTDISGFDTGVMFENADKGKGDTNWFWFSYIRLCNTCIWEKGRRVDDNVWYVNIDASLPGSTAARIGGTYGRWYIIMGAFGFEKTNNAVVLEPGAQHNVIEVHPPLEQFKWEDNSGNDTNVILSSMSAPLKGVRPPLPEKSPPSPDVADAKDTADTL